MINLTLSHLVYTNAHVSPLFTSKYSYTLSRSSLLNQISTTFRLSKPGLKISKSLFKNYAASAIRISSEDEQYYGVYTKRIDLINKQSNVEIYDSAFVSIKSQSSGGALYIKREPNEHDFKVNVTRSKFYNCSTAASGAGFWTQGVNISIFGCCATHCRAQTNSAFSITSTNLVLNSSFARQCASKDLVSGQMYVNAIDAHVTALNLTKPDANTEAGLRIEFQTSKIRYINYVAWESDVACKLFAKDSAENLIRCLAFSNVTTNTTLIGVRGKFRFEVICIDAVTMPTAFREIPAIDIETDISVYNSMLDEDQINKSFVTIDQPKYNRSMTFIQVDIGYGPGCYNTPPPLPSPKQQLFPYFIISGIVIAAVIIITAVCVIFHVKTPRAFEETSQLQTYRLKDKFGEALITS